MSPETGKSSQIRHIVRVRQMLCRWRKRASTSCRPLIESDAPAGHVAICVGSSCRRFIVRATYLNHPMFEKLLLEAEEEYGFNNKGPLTIPCEESEFQDILCFLSITQLDPNNKSRTFCHVANVADSKPLLHGSVY
ncbi:hypothetical protein M8C21_002339 [Ambrosia artemisiifolia]|uniref:Uncharacterized protein n=1 Tax=Ambrosia artemisiifolia TaxID=4212 RepID=A0AAD5DBL1_AMBAR|nr:hypothetical protein M8C21_002339 [Ambrosia artemisiifolia]